MKHRGYWQAKLDACRVCIHRWYMRTHDHACEHIGTHLFLLRDDVFHAGVLADVPEAKPGLEHCQVIEDLRVHKVQQAPQLL